MINGPSNDYFEIVESLLIASLERVKENISEQDHVDIKEHIDYGEYGVGWELLWHLVHIQQLSVPSELVECGNKMGFDTSTP